MSYLYEYLIYNPFGSNHYKKKLQVFRKLIEWEKSQIELILLMKKVVKNYHSKLSLKGYN